MSAGDLKQQLAVAHAESAEFNEKAIQASTQAEGLQTQVGHLTQTNNCCCRHGFPEAVLHIRLIALLQPMQQSPCRLVEFTSQDVHAEEKSW